MKLKMLFLIVFMFAQSQTQAGLATMTQERSPQSYPYSPKDFEEVFFELSINENIEKFADVINQVQLETPSAYHLSQTLLHDKCTVFMDRSQFLGKTGQNIFNLLVENSKKFPHIMHGGSVAKYCKKFPTMTVKQKALVWVLILTVVAHFESSCNISASAKGPNGTAFGFFQLHKGKEHEYDRKKGMCEKNASSDERLSSQCTLSMIDLQLMRSQGQLFSNRSYWDVLRPNGSSKKAKEIAKALTKFNLCNPVAM